VNTVSESAQLSLAQRIAKVRNCMLVEVATGVSVTNKDLFMSLCQTYEQDSVETSCTASASPQNAAYQAFSFSHLVPESSEPHEIAAMLRGDTSPRQYRISFSTITWPNLADGDDFDDWDPDKGK
jgi:hypothetical protein